MSTVMTSLKQFEDELMKSVERVEKPVLRYLGETAESVAKYVPERPEWAFLEKVPSVKELVEFQLKFTKRVVDHQATFVRKAMKAMDPALVRIEPKKVVKSTKSTAKAA